jgi:zinc transport system permease protein
MNDAVSLKDFIALFGPSLLATAVAAALCGYLGFFVVVRRVAFMSAALGQISGLGVAFAFLLGSAFGHDPHQATPVYLDPVVIALLLTSAVAAAMGSVSRVRRTTPESVVAFAYLLAAALALLVLANPRIIQEKHEIEDLLFGNTVAVRMEHLEELIGVALLVAVSHVFLFKDLLFVSFDGEMAKTLGLPSTLLDLWLYLSIGISVAVATRAVGALPVFAFVVLPAGAALMAVESVALVIMLSVFGALFAGGLGFYLSFIKDLATGPMMVACCALYWPLAFAFRWVQRRSGAAST